MEIPRKNQKEMLEIKNTITEMKNDCFDELISRLGMAEERISKLEDISVETHKTKKQREQSLKRNRAEQNSQGLWDNYKSYNIPSGITKRKRKRERN